MAAAKRGALMSVVAGAFARQPPVKDQSQEEAVAQEPNDYSGALSLGQVMTVRIGQN